MQQSKRVAKWIGGLVLLTGLGGCTTYYKFTDPASGRNYYTTNWNVQHSGWTGTYRILDVPTGKEVTLQSSERVEVSKFEYEQAVIKGGR